MISFFNLLFFRFMLIVEFVENCRKVIEHSTMNFDTLVTADEKTLVRCNRRVSYATEKDR